MFLRFLLLAILVTGCESPRYKEAYAAAKELGRSDVYAEALAQKYDEGAVLSYAVHYALTMDRLQETHYTDEERKKFSELYAEKKQEGKNADYAIYFASTYSEAVRVLKMTGKDEMYVRTYAMYYLDAEEMVNKRPELVAGHRHNYGYVMSFCSEYAINRADGKGTEAAIAAGKAFADVRFDAR